MPTQELIKKTEGKELMPSPSVTNQNIPQIEGWLKTRKEFIDKVASMAVEGKDFHIIKNSKSLAKGGAEKIASIFHWTAQFRKDTETLEMLGNPKDVIAYICELKNGEYVGEGRGARRLIQDQGDINKAIKMAQKSAYIDAVLRASGLSDIFTQDLEDMNQGNLGDRGDGGDRGGAGSQEQPSKPTGKTYRAGSKNWNVRATEKQQDYIQTLARERGIAEISKATGINAKKETLTKNQATDIIEKLLAIPVSKAPKVGAMGVEIPEIQYDDLKDAEGNPIPF